MAAWRYEISLLVLKKYFTSERSERVKYFSTLEEKFRISAQPCNILYLFKHFTTLLARTIKIELKRQIFFILDVSRVYIYPYLWCARNM